MAVRAITDLLAIREIITVPDARSVHASTRSVPTAQTEARRRVKAASVPRVSGLACRVEATSLVSLAKVATSPVKAAIAPVTTTIMRRAAISPARVATSLARAAIAPVTTTIMRRAATSPARVATASVPVATASVRAATASVRAVMVSVRAATVSVPVMIPMRSIA